METQQGWNRPGGREGFGDGETRAREGAESMRQGVGQAAETARQGYAQAAGAAQSAMGEARGYVQSAVEQTRHKVQEYREEGWSRLSDDVVEYTRAQPMAALGMAAAVGLLLGWLSAAGRR